MLAVAAIPLRKFATKILDPCAKVVVNSSTSTKFIA
jgi:hypothetical protein